MIQSKPSNPAEAAAQLCSPTAAGGSGRSGRGHRRGRRGCSRSEAPCGHRHRALPSRRAYTASCVGHPEKTAAALRHADEIKRGRHHADGKGIVAERPHEAGWPGLTTFALANQSQIQPSSTPPNIEETGTAPARPAGRKGRGAVPEVA